MMEVRKIGGSDTCWRAKTVEAKIAKIQELVTRPIKWNIVRAYQKRGRIVTCELCNNEDYTGYWCKPCIHPTFCCECCILLGIPNYATGAFVFTPVKTEGGKVKDETGFVGIAEDKVHDVAQDHDRYLGADR